MHYGVGGNSKYWGSVLYRLRREDFLQMEHADGISPAWPIDYETLAPYYDAAERLYSVHGQSGIDPTEPPRAPYPHAPVPHAPRIAELVEALRARGLHPAPLPLGLARTGRTRRVRAVQHLQFVSLPAAGQERGRRLLRASGADAPERDPGHTHARPAAAHRRRREHASRAWRWSTTARSAA